MTNQISTERLLNTRAWAAARIGSLSGAEVIVGAIDELLARRELSKITDAVDADVLARVAVEPPAPLKHQGYDGKIHEGVRSKCTKCELPERRDWCSICGATVTIPHEHFQPDYNALNRGEAPDFRGLLLEAEEYVREDQKELRQRIADALHAVNRPAGTK